MIPELQNTLLGRKRRANEGEGIMNNTFTNRPVTMNENKNLLEIEEHMYILDDVKKPNVFRNMFPYSEIPKIPFNDRTVPHDMPKDIWITDTTCACRPIAETESGAGPLFPAATATNSPAFHAFAIQESSSCSSAASRIEPIPTEIFKILV